MILQEDWLVFLFQLTATIHLKIKKVVDSLLLTVAAQDVVYEFSQSIYEQIPLLELSYIVTTVQPLAANPLFQSERRAATLVRRRLKIEQ